MDQIILQLLPYIVDILPHMHHIAYVDGDRILNLFRSTDASIPWWDVRKNRYANVQRNSRVPEIHKATFRIDGNTNIIPSGRKGGMCNGENMSSEIQQCSENLEKIKVPACFRCAPKKCLVSGKNIKRGMHLVFDDWLQVLEFPKETVYKPKVVVRNAKRKLGEKKFHMFTNRSSHMAWSCKVQDKDNQNRTPKRKYVKKNGDVKVGDLVNFKYCGLPHQGIVTHKIEKAEILNIEFIYISQKGVVEECSSEIDMGKTNIFLCTFRHLKIHTNAQILENAQSKLGQKLNRKQFLEECILR